jgi:hypothetical protein
MATLREYYFTEFSTLSTQMDHSLRPAAGGPPVTVIARVHSDFTSYVRYVSFFIEEGSYTPSFAAYLSQYPTQVLDRADSSVEVTSSHPAVYGAPLGSKDLPFSGRVFLYIDQIVPVEEQQGLISAAAAASVHLEIKDKTYAEYLTYHEHPRAFISHDSRDKDSFVRPLAAKLRSMMCPVWYDEYSLKVGHSLRESIDKGLKEAPKVILVLSPNSLSNHGWTKAEFNAAMNKHITSGGSVILPIWHNVSRSQVEEYSLLISDTFALNSNMDMDELTRRLFIEINSTK